MCTCVVIVCLFLFFLTADVEKRANPVCHFVTPLEGNLESDINRSSEVKLEQARPLCPHLFIDSVLWIACKHSDITCLLQINGTEGKCWKRRIEIVIREYHKWRTYFKKRVLPCFQAIFLAVALPKNTNLFALKMPVSFPHWKIGPVRAAYIVQKSNKSVKGGE